MAIQAIETAYAGCRFRSRLEARWAVFFDHIGAEWEYEPQGFDASGVRYLPDFWLPEAQIFAEVKAEISHQAMAKLMAAVPFLIEPPDKQIKPQLVVLGPIPRPGMAWTHSRLDTVGDFVLFSNAYWRIDGFPPHLQAIGQRVVFNRETNWLASREDDTHFFRENLVKNAYEPRLTVDPIIDAGYTAARSARFEFGESGAPR